MGHQQPQAYTCFGALATSSSKSGCAQRAKDNATLELFVALLTEPFVQPFPSNTIY